MLPLLVRHVLQSDGLACLVVRLLLFRQGLAAPFGDAADTAVLVRPCVPFLLLRILLFSVVHVRFQFRQFRVVLFLYGTRGLSGARHELDSALFHIHLQGRYELPSVIAFHQLVFYRQPRTEHFLLLFGDFRLSDSFRYAYLAGRDIGDFVRLAVNADVRGDNLSGFLVHKVNHTPHVAGSLQVPFVVFRELVSFVFVKFLFLADEMRYKTDAAVLVFPE